MKSSLYLVLFVAFIDFMGIGLIYPLFSSMLFDSSCVLLSATTSHKMRGLCLGFLLSLVPITQFFSAPIWGTISDNKGRKKPLQISLIIAILGYIIALYGVFLRNIVLLFVSRIVIGCGAGNMSIVQATIADISSEKEKAKNFGLYSMSLGVGFTLGPFFGGFLSSWGYSIPFVFAAFIIAVNLIFTSFFFKETHRALSHKKLSWSIGLSHVKKAFRFHGVRIILLSEFLHNFAWSYFFEFIPVYLITQFTFSSAQLGIFYAAAGGMYAVTTGLLIRPFIRNFKPATLFFGGNLLAALTILMMPLVVSSFWIWPLMLLSCYFVGFIMPTAITLISNNASSQNQGEALGILSSVNAAAFGLSPLFSGLFVGMYPALPMWVGGTIMLFIPLLLAIVFRNQLFKRS